VPDDGEEPAKPSEKQTTELVAIPILKGQNSTDRGTKRRKSAQRPAKARRELAAVGKVRLLLRNLNGYTKIHLGFQAVFDKVDWVQLLIPLHRSPI